MRFQTKYTDQQWADARRLRAEGLTIAAVAERIGIRPATLRKRAQAEHWETAGGKRHAVRRVGPLLPAAARARLALVQGLYTIMDLELRALELNMKTKLDAFEKSPDAKPPVVTEEERASFAALIDNINKVTEMAAEPALAADGRRKSATLNPELTALSDELDGPAIDAASQKDQLRRDIADKLERLVPPSAGS
jgi:transposase-like protein